MDQRRLSFDTILRDILGSKNVYFQPPPNVKMQYPCIKYSFAGIVDEKADDLSYIKNIEFTVVYIDRSPTLSVVEKLLELPMSSVSRRYCTDGLNHTILNIYF